MTDWTRERHALIDRWYGAVPKPGPNRRRTTDAPISERDYLGIPPQVNGRFKAWDYCLAWRRSLTPGGYGQITMGETRILAHRAAYQIAGGIIPQGAQLNHLCNRPYCVQPAHLYPGTPQDNADDRKVFHSHSFWAEEMLPHVALEQIAHDQFLTRLANPARYDTPAPWSPPIQHGQGHLTDWTCPGHDFQIPAGDAKICRICDSSDHDQIRASIYASEVTTSIFPGIQSMMPTQARVISESLSGPKNVEWLQRIQYRCDHRNGTHELRTCSCHLCTRDKTQITGIVTKSLTDPERQVLSACQELRPAVTVTLDEIRQKVIHRQAESADTWTEAQKHQYRNHLPHCSNTTVVRKQHLDLIEAGLASCMLPLLTHTTTEDHTFPETMRELEARVTPIPGWLSESQYQALQPLLLAAFSEVTATIVQRLHALRPAAPENLITVLTNTAIMLTIQTIASMANYDLSANSIGSRVRPHPHEQCGTEISQPSLRRTLPKPMSPGHGFTEEQFQTD